MVTERERLRNRAKQQRFREKRDAELAALREANRWLLDALACAAERGRCYKLCDNLPEDQAEASQELAERLDQVRLIVCRREDVQDG